MSLPQKEANLVGTHVYPVADLGLSASLASGSTDTGTTFSTGMPATVVLLSKLTSGSADIKIDRASAAGSINFSSPDVTLACSGTSLQVASLDTTSSELFVGIQQVTSGSAAVWNQLAVMVLYELTAGEDWFSVRSGANAVGNNTVGNGGGEVPLAVA
jgi:hypothetical protein